MVEYIGETHTYLVDGVIVPSVTQLLQFKFPNKYSGIPQKVLDSKAEYGTKIHKLIEIMNDSDDIYSVCSAIEECADYITASAIKQYIKLYIENDFLKVSYRKASTRTTVDSKKLKEELPDIYEAYTKTSNVASSIVMEVK